jgi:hypothetical protein
MRDPAPPTDRIRILLFASNPLSTGRLAIEEEARAIAERLRLSRDRDAFDLITCWAVRPADLLQYLNQYRPHVVHFSGHGARTGELLLSAGDGTGRPVDAAALAELFRIMGDDVRVVLLNACYTDTQARAISRHVDFVIGTRAPVTDDEATVFAAAFYSALGFGRTVPQAFDQAKASLMVHGLTGHDIPELLIRPGAVLNPLFRARNDGPAEGVVMNPSTGPTSQGHPSLTGPAHLIASGSGAIVTGHGNVVSTGSNITNNINQPAAAARKGVGFDTKLVLGVLAFDVCFFFYGMWSYTGQNTPAETGRAVAFLVMVGVTGGMIRRWFRRRT